MSNISWRNFIPTVLVMVLIFIVFHLPSWAVTIVASMSCVHKTSVVKLFALQRGNIANASAGLKIILLLLFVSMMIALIGAILSTLMRADNLCDLSFFRIIISLWLEIISLFGIMVTIASLMYAQSWAPDTLGTLYRLLEYMSIISYGAITLKPLFIKI